MWRLEMSFQHFGGTGGWPKMFTPCVHFSLCFSSIWSFVKDMNSPCNFSVSKKCLLLVCIVCNFFFGELFSVCHDSDFDWCSACRSGLGSVGHDQRSAATFQVCQPTAGGGFLFLQWLVPLLGKNVYCWCALFVFFSCSSWFLSSFSVLPRKDFVKLSLH